MTFWDHVEILRKCLLRSLGIILCGMVVSLFLSRPIIQCLTGHLQSLDRRLVVLGPLEGMLTTLKVAFWMGLVGTAPLWSFLIFRFVAPGLKAKERRLVLPFLLLSLTLLCLGALVAYFGTLPVATRLLLHFNEALGQNLWSLSQAVSFSVILILAHALAFELFAILLFLVHLGKLDAEGLVKQRRLSIVLAFTLAAIVTPPDVVTQGMLAAALIILYEGVILYARSVSRSHAHRRDPAAQKAPRSV